MSWDQYIADLTSQNSDGFQAIEYAAIWGNVEPFSLWATSQNFHTEEGDIKQLSGDRSGLFVKGIKVEGKKCVLVRDELDTSNLMYLKTHKDSEGNHFFLSIGKTKLTFIIAKGSKDAQGGQVADKLHKTLKHLRDAGF